MSREKQTEGAAAPSVCFIKYGFAQTLFSFYAACLKVKNTARTVRLCLRQAGACGKKGRGEPLRA